MQRNRTGGQVRDDDEATLEKPEIVPSFLTARELQARVPAKGGDGDGPIEERPAASLDGEKKPKGRKAPRS